MTREEARQIIATWLVSSKGAKGQRGYIEGWFDEEDAEAFSMAIETLSRPKGDWISCSERLPKKGEVVLITNGKGNVRCGQYRSEHDVRGETHYWWWKGKTIESVLAWMPLPKPYREESEVEE